MKLLIIAALIGLTVADKIVGGQQAAEKQFPYIVHLDSSSVEAFCDGSILTEYWILSAAHCYQRGTGYKAVAGDQSLSDNSGNEQAIDIATFIPHEDYKSRTMENDIMLIKLASPLTMTDYVERITYPSERPSADVNCDISGWGNVFSSATLYPDNLQWVTVPVVATSVCNAKSSYNGEVLEMMICIGEMEGGKDSCQGDSGGPVVLSGTSTQVGIVSWGYGCAEKNYPGIYTDVYYFVENGWIDNTMAANL